MCTLKMKPCITTITLNHLLSSRNTARGGFASLSGRMKPQCFQHRCEVQWQSQTGHNHIPHAVAGLVPLQIQKRLLFCYASYILSLWILARTSFGNPSELWLLARICFVR